MPLRLRVTVAGAKVLDRALSRFGDDIKDFREVWRRIYADFISIEKKQFETEGGRGGLRWVPLSPSYAEWKMKHYPGKTILDLTGELRRQMTTGAGMEVVYLPLTLSMQPTVQRAYWHHEGVGRLPARKVVWLTESDKVNWIKMVHEYVRMAIHRGGLD